MPYSHEMAQMIFTYLTDIFLARLPFEFYRYELLKGNLTCAI